MEYHCEGKTNHSCFLVVSLVLSGCVSDRGLLADLGLQKSSHAPNIVLILTDDQDLLLDSMEAMPQVNALLAKRGTTFSNFFVNLPLCCPACATLLRGQFPHNHGVMTNLWPTGGFAKAYVDGVEQATFATALQGAGYRTALVGKYLNGYPFKTEPTYIPPGWDEWWAPITDTAYGSYGYQVNHNGQIEEYGFGPEDYITDVMAQRAVAFITNTTHAVAYDAVLSGTQRLRAAQPGRACPAPPGPLSRCQSSTNTLVQRSGRQRQATLYSVYPAPDPRGRREHG